MSLAAFGMATFICALWARRNQKKRPRPQKPVPIGLSDLASSIRGSVRSLADARALVARGEVPKLPPSCRPPGLAIYPGSFNPPSRVHVEIAGALSLIDGVDAVWLDMTVHKDASKSIYIEKVASDRHQMARAAVSHLPSVGVTELMAPMGDEGWGEEYFDVLRVLLEGCRAPPAPDERNRPRARIVWVMGSDVVLNMRWWAEKACRLISKCDQLVVFQRKHSEDQIYSCLESLLGCSREQLRDGASGRVSVLVLGFNESSQEDVSSSVIRRYLVSLLDLVPLPVLRYIFTHEHLTEFYKSLYEQVDVRQSIHEAGQRLRRMPSRISSESVSA